MSWIPWLVGWLWFAPSPPVCRVRVVNMPLPQLRHHRLQVVGRTFPAAGLVAVPGGEDDVVLLGPRYAGQVELPKVCGETVVLEATPLPAQLEFLGLPPHAVLSCTGCPGLDKDTNYLPMNLPPMVTRGLRTSVSLWIRAPGFHSAEVDVVLYPGNNVVRVPMKPRLGSR